jgi:hypothetical protein
METAATSAAIPVAAAPMAPPGRAFNVPTPLHARADGLASSAGWPDRGVADPRSTWIVFVRHGTSRLTKC